MSRLLFCSSKHREREFVKKFALILIALTLLIFGGGYAYLRYFIVGPFHEQAVNGELPGVSDLTVNNDIGLLRVVASKQDAIQYQATKFIRISPAQSVTSALDSIKLTKGQTDSAAVIDIEYKNFRASLRKTDIEMDVPVDTNLKLNSQSANIWVEGVAGSIDIQSETPPNITATDNSGALSIKTRESKTHIYIPATSASTVVQQDSGLLRVVVAGDKSVNLAVRMLSGKMTLTLDPLAKPTIKVVTDGTVFDTTESDANSPTPGQGKAIFFGDAEEKPDITLLLGSADLTIGFGNPVALRARSGTTPPPEEETSSQP
jgi:hypothetical protein